MKDVRELVRELGAGGTTVFLSSHLLNEVEQVCNRAAIIDRGRVIVEGPVSELRPEHQAVKVLTSDQGRAREVIAAFLGPDNVRLDEEYLIVESSDGSVRELVKRLVAAEIGIDAIIPAHEQGLEDYFLGLTQSSDVDSSRSRAADEQSAVGAGGPSR
jgi:ABC-2 type transport system ATP-binding protein